jgi:hypothetical protein
MKRRQSFDRAERKVGIVTLNGICVAVTMLFLATACTKTEEESAQTVDYYRAHSEERRALVLACANDPARARNRPACINARAAEARESIGSLKDLPPMGLTPDSGKKGDAR